MILRFFRILPLRRTGLPGIAPFPGQRWEPVFLSSRSEERRIPGVCERRATTKWGKWAPALRVAGKIGPYFSLALDSGAATAFGHRLRPVPLRWLARTACVTFFWEKSHGVHWLRQASTGRGQLPYLMIHLVQCVTFL